MIIKRNVQLELNKLPVQPVDDSIRQDEVDLQMEAGISSASDDDVDGNDR